MGAGKLVGAARSTQRAALAAKMGADKFFAVDDAFQPNVIEYLGGRPDIVIEAVGAPGILETCVELVRSRGTIVGLGVCFHRDTLVPATALLKELTIKFAVGTHLKQFRTVADSLNAGHIEPLDMVTDTISLDQLPSMFEALRKRTSQCKVLVDPWR
jgi:(R,R)-butanediol dehydrogenase/meso-butanediol dehydrogenase/diacetyl reductase